VRAASAYDRALALCLTPEAKLALARLGAELGLPASAPEWIILTLYAEAHGLYGSNETKCAALSAQMDRIEERIGQVEGERAALLAQLNRIEARLEQTATLAALEPALRRSPKQPSSIEVRRRDLYVFTAVLVVFVLAAISATGLPPPPFVVLIATFVLGLGGALLYLWLSPIVTRRK
jgi:hypothetical protein